MDACVRILADNSAAIADRTGTRADAMELGFFAYMLSTADLSKLPQDARTIYVNEEQALLSAGSVYNRENALKALFLFVVQSVRTALPFCAKQLFVQRFGRNKMKAALVKVLYNAFSKHALFFGQAHFKQLRKQMFLQSFFFCGLVFQKLKERSRGVFWLFAFSFVVVNIVRNRNVKPRIRNNF